MPDGASGTVNDETADVREEEEEEEWCNLFHMERTLPINQI